MAHFLRLALRFGKKLVCLSMGSRPSITINLPFLIFSLRLGLGALQLNAHFSRNYSETTLCRDCEKWALADEIRIAWLRLSSLRLPCLDYLNYLSNQFL